MDIVLLLERGWMILLLIGHHVSTAIVSTDVFLLHIEFGENVVVHIMLMLLVESDVHGEFVVAASGE